MVLAILGPERLTLGSVLRRLTTPMRLSAVEGRLWLSTGGAALLFALSRPATSQFGVLGYVLFLTQFLAVGLPAYRLGRWGAWGGAALSAIAFLTADLAYGVAERLLTSFTGDVLYVLLTSAALAVFLGELGDTLRRQRVLPDVLAAFSKQVLTIRDPDAVLDRALRSVMDLVGVDGAAVWLRRSDHPLYVCRSAHGRLAGLQDTRVPPDDIEHRCTAHAGGVAAIVPFEALPEADGWLVVTRPPAILRRFPRGQMRGLGRLAEVGALAFSNAASYSKGLASERRFQDLFNGLPSGFIVTDGSGRIELANPKAESLFGRPPSGLDLRQFVAETDWPCLAECLVRPRPGEPVLVTLVSATGERRKSEWFFGSHTGPSGRRTLAFFWDAEEKSRREEENTRLAAAMRSLREGVVLADLEGRILFANPAAVRIYGYATVQEMVGQPLIQHVAPDCLARFEDVALAQSIGCSDETQLVRADGSQVSVHITASPVRVEGQLIGTVCVVTDLTEQKEIAAKAATADKLATLGRLVAGAAHEINNPLAAILANAELLQVGGSAPREVLNEALDVIIQESRRAGRIVHSLLSFARQHPVARTEVNLRNLVCDVVALRAAYQKASGIQVTVSSEGPEIVVHADPDQLKQVLLNLIVNAEDALKDQPIRRLWSRSPRSARSHSCL